MTSLWRFHKKQPGHVFRNSMVGEHFSATEDVAAPLVREGIQNSLDARGWRPDNTRDCAVVRIYLSGEHHALSAEGATHWFGTLMPHVDAHGSWLSGQPKLREHCPFIVFEDFGTSGLSGDPEADDIEDGATNHFFRFFRAEGVSGSGEEKTLGSWGVGKSVFCRASQISSILALTVRANDARCLLMGRAILRHHKVGADAYSPDGYFGEERGDGFTQPSENATELERFRQDFRLKRTTESGLSVVIPWCDIDPEDGITATKVYRAVFREFFYPILLGHLSVTVEDGDGSVTLNAKSVLGLDGPITDAQNAEARALTHLADWGTRQKGVQEIVIRAPPRDRAQVWNSGYLQPAEASKMRIALVSRDRIAVRIPMTVRAKGAEEQSASFRVFLEYCDADGVAPIYIRNELTIPAAKVFTAAHIRSIVLVEEQPLAQLLRDAETPAHTEWSPNTGNFKNKYFYGPAAIKYVQQIVRNLVSAVRREEQEPDTTATEDYFTIPARAAQSPPNRCAPNKKQQSNGKEPARTNPLEIDRRHRSLNIDRTIGGFTLRGEVDVHHAPQRVEVKVAYDIPKGNPFAKYDPLDFDMAGVEFTREPTGATIKLVERNIMLLDTQQAAFKLTVHGFDEHRDLCIRVNWREVSA